MEMIDDLIFLDCKSDFYVGDNLELEGYEKQVDTRKIDLSYRKSLPFYVLPDVFCEYEL